MIAFIWCIKIGTIGGRKPTEMGAPYQATNSQAFTYIIESVK